MARDTFIDPNTDDEYEFDINHNEEKEFGRKTAIEDTAPTSGVGFVRQQGEPEPLRLGWQGTILKQSQYEAMWDYYDLCRTQTIQIQDFTSVTYEVIITAFNPVRKRCASNPRGGTTNPTWFWTYDLEMEVIQEI